MSAFSKRALFWTPRGLAILFIGFLALFALDVFNEHLGAWATLVALARHLIPNAILAAVLVVAWRWEWIGTALFAAMGLLYVNWVVQKNLPVGVKWNWCIVIAGPLFVMAALFLANWLKHDEIRA